MSSVSDGATADFRFHDIFLDFFNRDSRQINELFRILGRAQHLALLKEHLNLAVFLCRHQCIMPPGFAAEDDLVRATLSVAEGYTHERLVRWPIRESLDEYWAKKELEYGAQKSAYSGLFEKAAQEFVENNAHLLLDRRTTIGTTLVQRWDEAPDVDRYWRSQTTTMPAAVIEVFRRIPRQLLQDGSAVTWLAIQERVKGLADRYPQYRRLVQRIYFEIYIKEYDLRVMTGLPLARLSFGLGAEELFYRYEAIEAIVQPSGLWHELLRLSSWDMVRLRRMPDYFRFRELAYELCAHSHSLYELRARASVAPSDTERIRRETAVLAGEVRHGQLALDLEGHTDDWVEAFAGRIASVAQVAYDRMEGDRYESTQRRGRLAGARAALRGGKDPTVRLAIFAALKEERDVLIERWGLTGVEGVHVQWEGECAGANVVLYGAERLGRVPAAIATARLLAGRNDFDLIVVVGLAGGFPESGVGTGAILIPYHIADLASRKVTEDSSNVRPEPYDVDRRLGRYVENQFRDKEEWVAAAIREAHWPEDRRPHLKFGDTIACLDEVVADGEYRARLLDAWPKLQGVEMEAGGVIPAARELGSVDVAVVRAVSDMADPAKADDEWRLRGILTIAILLEKLDWPAVIAMAR